MPHTRDEFEKVTSSVGAAGAPFVASRPWVADMARSLATVQAAKNSALNDVAKAGVATFATSGLADVMRSFAAIEVVIPVGLVLPNIATGLERLIADGPPQRLLPESKPGWKRHPKSSTEPSTSRRLTGLEIGIFLASALGVELAVVMLAGWPELFASVGSVLSFGSDIGAWYAVLAIVLIAASKRRK